MKKLRKIYNRLPSIACQGKCQQSCGPIGIYPAEAEAIQSAGHSLPTVGTNRQWGILACSALSKEGQCKIYDNRPFICRLFGVVEALKCPYGCIPRRWMSDRDAYRLMDQIRQLKRGDVHISPQQVPVVQIKFGDN